MKRQVKRLPDMAQRTLGLMVEEEPVSRKPVPDDRFLDDDPRHLRVGEQRVDAYLQQVGLEWVVRLRQLLEGLDYTVLTQAYQCTGRKAIHPRVLLGLMVYGMISRQWSLRDLETLARRDVGAWWLCGGQQPDHSTIGKFIQLHAAVLTEEFFVALVRQLVGRLRLAPGTVAGDGTVIEAAAGHYRRLKMEAAQLAAEEARRAAQAAPEQAALEAQAQAAEAVAQAVAVRVTDQHARGRGSPDLSVHVAPAEPEAVVQPTKDGRWRPAYKPSTLVHESGLIVGQHVHPASEPAAVPVMLAQHTAVFGHQPARLLLDAGYWSLGLLELAVAADLDVLCPAGKATTDENWERTTYGGRFAKSAFRYEAAQDVYHCPAGRTLGYEDGGDTPRGGRYRRYRGRACGSCPLRARCTTDPHGRTIKRYEREELKEAMVTVLTQPRARAKYRERSRLAEPPFAELRERQALKRFRRRGLSGVRVEFALHCMAFNLKKALNHPRCLFMVVLYRRSGGTWLPAGVMCSVLL